jgi:hypothetical protein
MENNLEESDSFIEDISEDTLLTLDETLESDQESEISEAKGKVKKEDDDKCNCNGDCNCDEEDEMGEGVKVDPKDIDGKDDDDKEDDGDGMDKPGDEDSDVDNDGDSDEADSFLKKRRKAIAKNTKMKEDIELEEGSELDEANFTMPYKVTIPNKQTRYFKDSDSAKTFAAKTSGAKVLEVSKKEIAASHDHANTTLAKHGFKRISGEGGVSTHKHSDGSIVTVNHHTQTAHHSSPGKDKNSWVNHKDMHMHTLDTDMKDARSSKKESIDTSDIDRLCESEEGLTEEFKEKASFIFEAAVLSKVNEIEATLKEQYETRLTDEVDAIKTTLEEQVDNYLTYAVESWVEDNKVAIESSLRTQMAENFISALKNVFVENYVEVPDSKVDLFDQLDKDNQNLKEEAAKANRIAESLADRVDALVRERVIAEAAAGLADTQVDKLKKLVEDVEFIDESAFAKKVETIKEFYLNGQSTDKETLTEGNDSYFTTETIVEGDNSDENVSPEMKAYLTALSRMNRAMTADLL